MTVGAGIVCGLLVLIAVVLWQPNPLLTALPIVAWFGLWLLLRRPLQEHGPRAWAVVGAGAVLSGALTAMNPNLAVVQAATLTAAWVVLGERVLFPIVASVLVAAATAAGFVVALGTPGLPVAAFSEGLSLAFAICIGLWIDFYATQSDTRGRLIAQLEAAQHELAAMYRDAGVVEERARMAREIHDTVAQSLTGIVLLSQRARHQAAGEPSPVDPAALAETVALIESAAGEALAEARTLVAANSAVELGAGLAEALVRLGQRFERESGIRVLVDAEQVQGLDRDRQVVVLRCAQEALANARKHSGADEVRLSVRERSSAVVLEVRDDGRGFDPSLPGSGFGLSGMSERLTAIGGRLELHGEPGAAGVSATLPLGGAA